MSDPASLSSLNALLGHAERSRDLALAAEAAARTAHGAARAKAEELVDYRQSYERRWNAAFTQDGAIELVRCYQGFVERLSQAIDHQQRAVHAAESRLVGATAQLRELEVRAAAIQKLIDRRTGELLLAADRLEQRQTDEHAARVAWNRQAALSHPTLG